MYYTAQKMKFSMKGFFSKCDQIRSFQNHQVSNFCHKSLITANFDETVADLNQCENESSHSEMNIFLKKILRMIITKMFLILLHYGVM